MKKAFLPNIFIIILFSCQTTQYSSPESFQGKQIIISENGGFSGQTTRISSWKTVRYLPGLYFLQVLKKWTSLKRKLFRKYLKKLIG